MKNNYYVLYDISHNGNVIDVWGSTPLTSANSKQFLLSNKVGNHPRKVIMSKKLPPMPKPVISEELSSWIRQTNVVIDYAEKEGDLRLMIQAMAERADLFQQAVKESTQWYHKSLTTSDK